MRASLILGYGNPLRSDDGVAYKAAIALESELSSAEVCVVAAHQLLPEHGELASRVARVLFLDASHGGVPGEIRCQAILRDPYFQPGTLTHDLHPSGVLELASRYFHAEPEAWLLTLTGADFELGESFSAAVAAAWPGYLDRIRAWARG